MEQQSITPITVPSPGTVTTLGTVKSIIRVSLDLGLKVVSASSIVPTEIVNKVYNKLAIKIENRL